MVIAREILKVFSTRGLQAVFTNGMRIEGWMDDLVKIVECPRDAWQGLPTLIPAEVKADYLRVLVEAGFKHIDAVSFVSPKAIPQMADAERVLEYLMPPEDVEIIAIAVNA